MPCKHCGDSHSAFDPCPESIAAITREDLECGRGAGHWKSKYVAALNAAHDLATAVIEGRETALQAKALIDVIREARPDDGEKRS